MSRLQGTAATYDEATRAGTVLLDDGSRLAFDGPALRPEVLRLRPGQRVLLDVEDGVVRAATVMGMPLGPSPDDGRSPAWRTMGR